MHSWRFKAHREPRRFVFYFVQSTVIVVAVALGSNYRATGRLQRCAYSNDAAGARKCLYELAERSNEASIQQKTRN